MKERLKKSECIEETYACQCRGLKNNIFAPTFYLLLAELIIQITYNKLTGENQILICAYREFT